MNRYKRIKARRLFRFEYTGDIIGDGGKYFVVYHYDIYYQVYETYCKLNPQ